MCRDLLKRVFLTTAKQQFKCATSLQKIKPDLISRFLRFFQDETPEQSNGFSFAVLTKPWQMWGWEKRAGRGPEVERSNWCFTMMPVRDIFSIRMPPVVRVNVLFLGQRCADELILGMSRGPWRQRARVHQQRGGERGQTWKMKLWLKVCWHCYFTALQHNSELKIIQYNCERKWWKCINLCSLEQINIIFLPGVTTVL